MASAQQHGRKETLRGFMVICVIVVGGSSWLWVSQVNDLGSTVGAESSS